MMTQLGMLYNLSSVFPAWHLAMPSTRCDVIFPVAVDVVVVVIGLVVVIVAVAVAVAFI